MSEVVDAFYREYGKSGVWFGTFWLGRHVYKCPTDLWMYQEILHDTRPDLIIETGTFSGGSALFLASMCDLIGRGRIVTIDVEPQDDLPCPSAHQVPRRARRSRRTFSSRYARRHSGELTARWSILDSDHSKDHVLAELKQYAPLVSDDCYLIVEDTTAMLATRPSDRGPDEAIEEFSGGERTRSRSTRHARSSS